jgi:two-component system, chemotaxis family, protein-glutamate methylesterase/glutaminase
VDDSATVRVVLRRALERAGGVEIVGQATDGLEGLEVIRQLKPDVVTLDVEMPRLDGLATLERLMAEHPVPVVMVSTLTGDGAATTIRALELGAVDFIEKPTLGQLSGVAATQLVEKLRHAARAQAGAPSPARRASAASEPGAPWRRRVLVLGASTGGPQALRQVLTGLPPDFGLPVVVVQHMPAGFTASLASRFDELGPLSVSEAEPGATLADGHVLVATGGYHLEFDARGRALLTEGPAEHGVRPAINVTMASIAAVPGADPIGVILTGMGRDGVRGCQAIRDAGGTVIAEDESTCVVYGMPRAVAEAVLVDEVVPLDGIVDAILRHARDRAARPAPSAS